MDPTRHINNDKPGFGQQFINWSKILNDGTKGTFSKSVTKIAVFMDSWVRPGKFLFLSLTDRLSASFLFCILAPRCLFHTQGGSVSSCDIKRFPLQLLLRNSKWWMSYGDCSPFFNLYKWFCASSTGSLFRLSDPTAGGEMRSTWEPCEWAEQKQTPEKRIKVKNICWNRLSWMFTGTPTCSWLVVKHLLDPPNACVLGWRSLIAA